VNRGIGPGSVKDREKITAEYICNIRRVASSDMRCRIFRPRNFVWYVRMFGD
jgi:hypothetical protein